MVDNPIKKTLLALGFLKGNVVDDWADMQHNWINKQHAPTDPATHHVQVPSTNPIYWTHFITEFNQAYVDSVMTVRLGLLIFSLLFYLFPLPLLYYRHSPFTQCHADCAPPLLPYLLHALPSPLLYHLHMHQYLLMCTLCAPFVPASPHCHLMYHCTFCAHYQAS